MKDVNLDYCLRIARQIAREAGKMMLTAFHLPKQIEFKGRTDLVTETDKKIEEFVSTQLKLYFPTHKFLGEETMAALQASGSALAVEKVSMDPTWVVDPVDGTTNFVHSVPYSCVSIGLAVDGEAALGVVFNPVSNEMFTAIKGGGAFLNDSPVSVSTNQELIRALVATGIPYDKSYLRETVQGNLMRIQTHCQAMRINGSAALDLCAVACGRLDIYVEYAIHSWDVCAGAVIVKEAGGSIQDPLDKPFSLTNGMIIAGNADIVKSFLEVGTK